MERESAYIESNAAMTYPNHYVRPQSLAEAVERAARPGSIALAGGALTLGGADVPYDTVVDLQDLAELKRIYHDDEGVHVGGACMLQDVVQTVYVRDEVKRALTRAIPLNIRNGASVGESLVVTDPPREWLAALLVLDAQVEHAGHLAGGEKSTLWEQPLAEFVRYLHLHRHPYQGIITQVHIPEPNHVTVLGTAFVARAPADFPIVNAAVRVTLEGKGVVSRAVVAVGGASEMPVMALELSLLVGQPLDDDPIARALDNAESQLHPVSDYRGSGEYRKEMGGLMMRRALIQCLERVKSLGGG